MDYSSKKIRIKDIAKFSGVSKGTVDRVLHNRKGVSEKSRQAVEKVLNEMNYSPNVFARSLASKKRYRIFCLFPAYQKGDYWENIENGFEQAAADFENYNVEILIEYFNQFDSSSFTKVSQSILEKEPDAIIMAPVFRNETIQFVNQLSEKKIPFSYIDSMIEETNFLTYYGQHSFQSGYVAAKLLFQTLPENSTVIITRTKRRGGAVSNQTTNRYNGFMKYCEEFQLEKKFDLLKIEIEDDNEKANFQLFKNIFSQYSNIGAAITFNSKVYRLANYLSLLNKTDIIIIGYDVLEKNVTFLKQGIISYLIAQRPEKQAYFSIRDMCCELIFKKPINKINYVPIDILIKENVDYYINFSKYEASLF